MCKQTKFEMTFFFSFFTHTFLSLTCLSQQVLQHNAHNCYRCIMLPELVLLAISLHLYYLPKEFRRIIVIWVYILRKAVAVAACEAFH